MNTLMSLDQISARYRGSKKTILKDFSLEIYQGKTITLFGESGSGKTSLLNLMTGNFHELGLEVVEGSLSTSGKVIIGFVPQNTYLLDPYQTLGEMFQELLHHKFQGDMAEITSRATRTLTDVGFPLATHGFHSYLHEWSGGMRLKVQLALSLALEPDLLLADEPFANLDEVSRSQLLQIFSDKKYFKSLVLISHDPFAFQTISDTFYVMKDGFLLESGNPKKILSSPLHPYTKAIIDSFQFKSESVKRIRASDVACPFSDRCTRYDKRCDFLPPLIEIQKRKVACVSPLGQEVKPHES